MDLAYPGYYIDKVESTSDCAGNYRYRMQEIRESDTTIYSCREVVGEQGWVQTSSSNHSYCSGRTRYTYSKSVGWGCTVPSGMVATQVATDSSKGYDCALGKVYKVEYPSDGLSYCAGIGGTNTADIPPEGMVVSKIEMSGDCDSRTTYTGEKVTVSTPKIGMVMCTKYGTVPSGFGISDVQNRGVCGSTSGLNAGGILTGISEGSAFCDLPTNLTGDWVIKDIASSGMCSGGYAYTIGEASRTGHTDICWVNSNDTSIPDDFMITNDKNSISGARCDGSATWSYKIALPSNTQYVCSLHNMPSNFGVLEKTQNHGDCLNTAFRIEQLNINKDYSICADQLIENAIPDGFVVTQVFRMDDCGLIKEAYKIEAPKANGITHVCQVQSPQNFPVGLVATDISKSRNCHVDGDEREGYDSHYPPTDSKSVMCDGSNLPAGFEYYTQSTPQNCNTLTAAKYIQIIGLEDAFLDPFVLPEVAVDPSGFGPTE